MKFDNPLDSMPISTNRPLSTNRYAPPEKMIELEGNPRPEEEIANDWFDATLSSVEPQDESDDIEATKTIHQKMYEIATSKYNPFSVGGSESIHDFQGGSENVI
tara:strand:+ start:56 stop:367 length:312 start_codon:yes stop_codon:yes gene_type:complete